MLSITAVLYMIGGVLMGSALIWNLKQQFKQQIHMNVYFRPTTPSNEIFQWEVRLKSMPSVRKIAFYSSEDALNFMESEVGTDIDSILGYNPFPPMLDIYFEPEYLRLSYLDTLAYQFRASPHVREVTYQRDLLNKLNTYFQWVLLGGGGLALLFFLISWVLINNAVRITLYSDRFVVRTMELVGATLAFIMRPYVIHSMFIGVVAGLLADLFILAMIHLLIQWIPDLATVFYQHIVLLGIVGLVLPVLGMLISGISTFFAVRRFLSMPLEELY